MIYYIANRKFKKISEWIAKNRDTIHEILAGFATYESIQMEIEASIRTLDHAHSELMKYRPRCVSSIAVYHPSNALLYSYILYVIVPCAFAKEITIRPSSITCVYLLKIHQLIQECVTLPVSIKIVSQNKFKQETKNVDLVIFTGRYENSLEVAAFYAHSIFVFFGSGHNSMVFSPDYSPEKAIAAIFKARLYNSGQDCFMSDVFFIPDALRAIYVKKLIEKIKTLEFGTLPHSDYGPLQYSNIFSDVSKFIEDNAENLIYKGLIDSTQNIIAPTVFLSCIDNMVKPMEFFSPIFNIVTYTDIKQVKRWLLKNDQLENAMGLSIYGNKEWAQDLEEKYNIFYEKTVLEAENGNEPFGGYGIKANYIKFYDRIITGPILISHVLSESF